MGGAGEVDSFTIEGYLLPLNKYIGVVNGKRSEMYQIIDTPPLHSYAKMKNQITTVSIDLLKAPLEQQRHHHPAQDLSLKPDRGDEEPAQQAHPRQDPL